MARFTRISSAKRPFRRRADAYDDGHGRTADHRYPRPCARIARRSPGSRRTRAVIGQVSLAARASVWYGATLRAEAEPIEIGFGTNIQDGVTVHVDSEFPVSVGAGVSVGHNAVLHGCEIEDDALIGMGAVILNGARHGEGSLIAAGALVPQGVVVPPRSLVTGVPGSRSTRTQRRRDRQQPPQRRGLSAADRAAPRRTRLTVTVPVGRVRVRTYGETNANPGHRRHRLCRIPARHRTALSRSRRSSPPRATSTGWPISAGRRRLRPSHWTHTTRTSARAAFAEAGPIDVVYYLVHGIGAARLPRRRQRGRGQCRRRRQGRRRAAHRLPRRVRARGRRVVRASDQPGGGRRTR